MDDAVDGGGGRVNAVWRQQLILGFQVGGRKSDRAAAPVAFNDDAVDVVLMAKQRSGLIHSSFADQPSDSGTADDEILVSHRVDLFGLEPQGRAERAEQREIAAPIVAEEKIRADPHFRYM